MNLSPTEYPKSWLATLGLQTSAIQYLKTVSCVVFNIFGKHCFPCVTPHETINSSMDHPPPWGKLIGVPIMLLEVPLY